MSTPQATTILTAEQAALQKLFQNWADESFQRSIDCQNEVGFYEYVLAKMTAKVDLTADLPEMKGMKINDAKAVVKGLAKQSKASVKTAWGLKATVEKFFHTTIRSHHDELSLLPCFDVEYKAETEKGDVTIAVQTWRRNVTVTVNGNAGACDYLHGQVVMAGMRG